MRTFVYTVTAGVLATALLSGCGKPRVQSDKDNIQGTWQAISMERMGKSMPGYEELELVIEGDTMTMNRGDKVMFKGNIKLDSSKKPKTLDMELVEDAPGRKKGQVSQGIYMIEGDTLKWCNAAPGVDDRPREFATHEEKNHMLVVLKREKT